LGHRLYVVGKDAASNTITVGPREMLETTSCTVGEANWLSDPPVPGESRPCLAMCRYQASPVPARVRILDPDDTPTPSGRRGRFEVLFARPHPTVAPGQALVLYDAAEADLVLGGGWIESAAKR
jgi:tRNA-specific 2-thiouridylase